MLVIMVVRALASLGVYCAVQLLAHLTIGREFLNLEYGRVHVLNVVQIAKHESFRRIETTSYDIFCIFISQPGAISQ